MIDENKAKPAESGDQETKSAELAAEDLDQVTGGAGQVAAGTGQVAIKVGWDQKQNKAAKA